MTAPEDPKTNGHKEEPEFDEVFEYLDADVWFGSDAQGNRRVAYTEDVEDAIEESEDSEDLGDSENGSGSASGPG